MKKRPIFLGIAVFAVCAIFFSFNVPAGQAAGKTITWKCPAHWPMASSSFKDSLVVVAERIKERTNGRLIIEPYPAGALVPGKENFNAVKRGMVPIAITSPMTWHRFPF
jgi:TRAP-type mannitol/chloroaromatic compound transport system substrate-binding protein